jgi:hypothetical protein
VWFKKNEVLQLLWDLVRIFFWQTYKIRIIIFITKNRVYFTFTSLLKYNLFKKAMS